MRKKPIQKTSQVEHDDSETLLQRVRTNWKFSQAEAADRMAISTSQLCRIESGQSVPTTSMAKKLSALYGLSIELVIENPRA